jgi:hypothetical protein
MNTTYYQPEMNDENNFLDGEIMSFEVYDSKENCIADFPNETILTFHNDDIEDRVYVDVDTDFFYFGIHNGNQNISTLKVSRFINHYDGLVNYEFNLSSGMIKDDEDVIFEIAVDLISYGKVREFDSLRGDTYYIEKLNSITDYENYLN